MNNNSINNPKMIKKADIIVIGAGPAGSTAARYSSLKLPNTDIVLIDKQSWPRDKPCAGGITKKVFNEFPELKKFKNFQGKTKKMTAYGQKYAKVTYILGNSKKDDNDEEFLFAMSIRRDFDQELIELIKEKNIEFWENTEAYSINWVKDDITYDYPIKNSDFVEVLVKKGNDIISFQCKIVIVAAGAIPGKITSKGHKWFPKLSLKPASTIMAEIPIKKEIVNKYWSKELQVILYWNPYGIPGYFWIFPKEKSVNLGLEKKKKNNGNILRVFKYHSKVLTKRGEIPRKIIQYIKNKSVIKGFPLPFNGMAQKLYFNRCLVIGDSGGFVSPLHGEGIYYAMLSGKLAAATLEKILKSTSINDISAFNEKNLKIFKKKINRHVRPYIKSHVLFQKILVNFSDAILDAAKHNKYVKWLTRILIVLDPQNILFFAFLLMFFLIIYKLKKLFKEPIKTNKLLFFRRGLLLIKEMIYAILGVHRKLKLER